MIVPAITLPALLLFFCLRLFHVSFHKGGRRRFLLFEFLDPFLCSS